jgi:hypothetical protein
MRQVRKERRVAASGGSVVKALLSSYAVADKGSKHLSPKPLLKRVRHSPN